MQAPDHEVLRKVLRYDPLIGAFTWLMRTSQRVRVGDEAGYVAKDRGYRLIRVSGHENYAHRWAWFYMTGKWPENEIDHINGVKTDNRWANLREADRSLNMQNEHRARVCNSSGLLGAHVVRGSGKFRAGISLSGKKKAIGVFDTAEEAHEAYLKAKRKLHPGCTI